MSLHIFHPKFHEVYSVLFICLSRFHKDSFSLIYIFFVFHFLLALISSFILLIFSLSSLFLNNSSRCIASSISLSDPKKYLLKAIFLSSEEITILSFGKDTVTGSSKTFSSSSSLGNLTSKFGTPTPS